PSENNAIGRVSIKTKIQGLVNEICKVVILGKSFNVSVKEFAGWVPDIKNIESSSNYHSDKDNFSKHDTDNSDNESQGEEEGEIPNSNINHEDEPVRDTLWSDEAIDVEKKQDSFSDEQQNPPPDMPEAPKEDSNSISKPLGFEGYKSNSPQFSTGGNRNSYKQPSNFSSAPSKATRVSKSRSKSSNNHGSMIDAFISHIEMGKVLGYDMEGSKNDLKKFIDSIGANNVHP
nr:RNA-directed DNA polymerase, eukaryota [Tanacetum cinerariifolium]